MSQRLFNFDKNGESRILIDFRCEKYVYKILNCGPQINNQTLFFWWRGVCLAKCTSVLPKCQCKCGVLKIASTIFNFCTGIPRYFSLNGDPLYFRDTLSLTFSSVLDFRCTGATCHIGQLIYCLLMTCRNQHFLLL